MSDANKVLLFISPRDQAFIPNYDRLFGSDFRKVIMEEADRRENGAMIYYEVIRTGWKALNQADAPCNERSKQAKAQPCINKKIAVKKPFSISVQ